MIFRSNRIRLNRVSEHPTQLYLELSTYCNLSCRTCPRNAVVDFEPAHFSPELTERLLDSIAELRTLKRIVLLGYGEALCHPHFETFLARLGATGIPVVLVTNAQLVTDATIDLLIGLPVHAVYVSWDDLDDHDAIRIGSDTNITRSVVTELRARKSGHSPLIGVEIVALKQNYGILPRLVAAARGAGAEHVIITNLFPYLEEMRHEILFTYKVRPQMDVRRLLGRNRSLVIAKQIITDTCACPFIERGTLFVTANGEVVPCLELAHAHTAWYFEARRQHNCYPVGNIADRTLSEIWNDDDFLQFREKFIYYDFPDCLSCYKPEMCYQRTTVNEDCFQNPTPCGECLWARGVILCP